MNAYFYKGSLCVLSKIILNNCEKHEFPSSVTGTVNRVVIEPHSPSLVVWICGQCNQCLFIYLFIN